MTAPIVTEAQLAEARAAVDQAAAEVRELHRKPWTLPAELQSATANRTAAEERLARLIERQAEWSAYLDARQAHEDAAAPELDRWAGELDASRARLVDAVSAAESAMLAALRATTAHDALVSQVRDGLIGHDLVGAPGPTFDTSAGERSGLWLRGRRWGAVDASGVLARSVTRVAHAVFGRGHVTFEGVGRGAQQRIPADLFEGQADLPQTKEPRRFAPWAN